MDGAAFTYNCGGCFFIMRKWMIALCLLCIINGCLLYVLLPEKPETTQKKLDISSYEVRSMQVEELEESARKELEPYIEKIQKDFIWFPVAFSEASPFVNYVNSWGYDRTYGGDRVHEGTDIMAEVNQRGYYPVVSVSDGVVENLGWLELGGYRIGIRSQNGIYFYYAHLYSYAPGIKEGDRVRAGQLIGYMGDSGYSKVEGTVGNFDVHLHFGIYIDEPQYGELSLNPYFFLKEKEKQLIVYNY